MHTAPGQQISVRKPHGTQTIPLQVESVLHAPPVQHG
jgi:hypothetical protein